MWGNVIINFSSLNGENNMIISLNGNLSLAIVLLLFDTALFVLLTGVLIPSADAGKGAPPPPPPSSGKIYLHYKKSFKT